MPTDFASLDALYPLPAEELPRQWLLTREEGAIPKAWEKRSLHGWHLGAHPDAHVSDLLSQDGAPIGWAVEPLAYLSTTGDVVPEESLTLPVSADADAVEFERALYGRDRQGRSNGDGLAGTWTAVVFGRTQGKEFQRVYVGAAHSVVYSSDRRAVASTHNLVHGLQRNEGLSRAFDCLSNKTYFTFSLTAFEGLRRLLPNHFLDLETFAPSRHWPVQPFEPLGSGERGAAEIVDFARRLIKPLTSRYDRFVVFLSAGRDSRAVLSMLRPFVEESVDVVLSTAYGWNFESRVDAQAARRLAHIVGLPHEVKRRRPHKPHAADVLRAFARVGEAAAGSSLSAPGVTRKNAIASAFKVSGMGGEAGRAFWWDGRRFSEGSRPIIDADTLVRRTRSPRTDDVLEAAEQWLSGLPPGMETDGPSILDLAYVEQRMGCWQAPMTYLFPGKRRVSSPMLETFPMETMLRLPQSYRASRVLQRDMVAYGWPELLAIPFNKPTDHLHLWHLVRQLPGLSRRVRRRLTRFELVKQISRT